MNSYILALCVVISLCAAEVYTPQEGLEVMKARGYSVATAPKMDKRINFLVETINCSSISYVHCLWTERIGSGEWFVNNCCGASYIPVMSFDGIPEIYISEEVCFISNYVNLPKCINDGESRLLWWMEENPNLTPFVKYFNNCQ
jgi:hypothetical protein